MAKLKNVEEATKAPEASEAKGIAPLGLNFGREDMNQLVAKVNEIIEKLNA